MAHYLIPESARVTPLITSDATIDHVVQVICAIHDVRNTALGQWNDGQYQVCIHDWTSGVLTSMQISHGLATYRDNYAWWQSPLGQTQCALLQVMLIDIELEKINARRGELRTHLMQFVAQHGPLTIAGVATARMMEQFTKVSYDTKQIDQVVAALYGAGHTHFAQTLEKCRKQTNIPAHIQIKRTNAAYA